MDGASFLKSWIKFTIYGWLIGFLLIIILAFATESIGLGGYQFFIGLAVGAGVGYMQGRFLKVYFNIGLVWVVMTTIGMGISFIFFDFANLLIDIEYNLFYSVAVGGLITSIAQYFILRSHFNSTGLWIPISWLGWLAAGGLVRFTELIGELGLPGLASAIIVLIILTVGASFTLGLVTGFGLKRIIIAQSESNE